MVRMLKENKPLKFFTVPSDRLRDFCSEGRKRGLLYVIIKDRKNPDMSEVMVFADDAAKVNRVMDKMNLDFVKSEVGQAVHEVTGEQEKAEVTKETVQMPEGEVQFEISELDEDFQFDDAEKTAPEHADGTDQKDENFTGAQGTAERICQTLPCAAAILLPGRQKRLGNLQKRSGPVCAGNWKT